MAITPTPSDNTTLRAVLDGYDADGFSASFTVEDDGRLRCGACGHHIDPADVDMSSLRRLEGASDPADMAAVLALQCPICEAKGTAVVRYGPEASPGDATILLGVNDTRGASDDSVPPAGPSALTPSSAPGASSAADAESTGGADAVPMTPADDGLAGRRRQGDDVEAPPAG